MGATIAKRIVFGLIVAGLAAWWATAQMHQPHYSDVPGQGALLQRTELPPLDAAKGGPIPLPADTGGPPATHYAPQPAAVEPPVAAPGPVTDRAPAATPQDPQLTPDPGDGAPVHDPMPGTSLFDQNPLSLLPQLPVCDAACLQRVLDQLTGGLPAPPPVTVPPVTLPTP
jgi:hypothetical protein